ERLIHGGEGLLLAPDDRCANEDAYLVLLAAHQPARLEGFVPVQDGQRQGPAEMDNGRVLKPVGEAEHAVRLLKPRRLLGRLARAPLGTIRKRRALCGPAPDLVAAFCAVAPGLDFHVERKRLGAVACREGTKLENSLKGVRLRQSLILARKVAIP